jgi:hypothetical protein
VNSVRTLRESPGLRAVIALAALTGLEYVVSAGSVPGSFAWLTIIALAKGAIILMSFMHLKNIFVEDV